jgi:hypothetical protein
MIAEIVLDLFHGLQYVGADQVFYCELRLVKITCKDLVRAIGQYLLRDLEFTI